MSWCRNVNGRIADQIKERAGIPYDDPRYRNGMLLCQQYQEREEPPFPRNVELAEQLRELHDVMEELWELNELGEEGEDADLEISNYLDAAEVIEALPATIRSVKQLTGDYAVDKFVKQRIQEWLRTGRIRLLNEMSVRLRQVNGEPAGGDRDEDNE